MRRLVAVLAVLALAGADAFAKERPLYGIVGERSSLALVELDPNTLQRVPGRRVRLGPFDSGAVAVRGGDLALADSWRLRFVNLETMKQFASVRIGPGVGARAVSWVDRRWVVAVLGGEGVVELVVVDRAVMKVARRAILRGTLVALEQTPSELVLLLSPPYEIGPARLVIVDARGRTREIPLERVHAGWHSDSTDPAVAERRVPGLAVDADARTAYVVSADGLVAEVPLHGTPRYHSLRGVYAKTIAGWWRDAEWLGAGVLAVSGSNSADGQTSTPAGVELIDTRAWSSRRVLAGATSVTRWRDGLLATGSGIGLAAVGRDGATRFRLLDLERVWLAGVTPTRAYAYREGSGAYVVDLLTAQVARRVSGQLPWLLPTAQLVSVP